MTNAHLVLLTGQMQNIDLVFPSSLHTSEKILLSRGRSEQYHVKVNTGEGSMRNMGNTKHYFYKCSPM